MCQLTWQLRPRLEIHVPHIGGICRLGAKGLQVTCDGQRAIQLDPTAHGVCLTSLVLLWGAYGVRILLTQLGHRIRGYEVALVELCGKAHDLILTLAALLLPQHEGLQYLYLLQSECETNEDFYYCLLHPHLLLSMSLLTLRKSMSCVMRVPSVFWNSRVIKSSPMLDVILSCITSPPCKIQQV